MRCVSLLGERPMHRLASQPDTDLAGLAGAYAYGLARYHAFVDGNKRVAFQSMLVFLGLNGFWLQ
ncbi:MAG: type II toxin-antitoxin system death-on-curing family toxin [Gemmatimonadetes bacterium]|nr:type II toxin-antitoxin system death-on-curing family toxin [Gemmatimonadota bacterium]